jgi:glycosyltransferase involved in cell wall biosynthesis
VTREDGRPLRLAIFTSQFPSRVSTFFARDVRGLIDAGVEVEIFPLYPLDDTLWRYVPGFLDERVLPRERVHHVGVLSASARRGPRIAEADRRFREDAWAAAREALSGGPASVAKTAYALAKARAWAAVHGGAFDHVLAYWGNYAATSALAFQRLTDPGIPVSMFLHAGTDLYRRPESLRRKLLYVDNVIVVCAFNRTFLEKSHPALRDVIRAKTHVHHIGLELADLPASDTGRRPGSLLAVGSFETAKGFDVLVRAVALLRARGLDVSADLVGDGPERAALARLAARLDVADHVHMRGWLPFEGVQAAMRRTALLVHPSSGLGDAVPTVIKEALALGTPVVASAVAGIPELLDGGACGVLVPPGEPERLADAVAALLGDAGRRRELARAGRVFAEKTFDARRNGRRLAEILRSTRRGAPGRAPETVETTAERELRRQRR